MGKSKKADSFLDLAKWDTKREGVRRQDADTYSARFIAILEGCDTVEAFLAGIDGAAKDRKDASGGDKESAEWAAMNNLRVNKSTVAKVTARLVLEDMDAKFPKAWGDVDVKGWKRVQGAIREAGTMRAALAFGVHGGTPAKPNRPKGKKGPEAHAKGKGKGKGKGKSDSATLPDWAEAIVATVRLELNDAEAENIANALHLGIERVKRAG